LWVECYLREFAAVIMDVERIRALWVGLGGSRRTIRLFFEQLGEYCRQIEMVAMDMNTAVDHEVRPQCPGAEVMYDLSRGQAELLVASTQSGKPDGRVGRETVELLAANHPPGDALCAEGGRVRDLRARGRAALAEACPGEWLGTATPPQCFVRNLRRYALGTLASADFPCTPACCRG